MSRKVTFAAGAFYAVMGIGGLVLAYRIELLAIIKAVLGETP